MTKIQDTDEDGNRMSILPSKKRPKIPSTKKKAPSVKKAKVKSALIEGEVAKEKEKKVIQKEEPKDDSKKTVLEKMQSQVEKLKTSNGISKKVTTNTQQRTNFVKMNVKNYKPRIRGAAFTNKMMAKKKNQLKFNDRIKRKMQIENAKNRD